MPARCCRARVMDATPCHDRLWISRGRAAGQRRTSPSRKGPSRVRSVRCNLARHTSPHDAVMSADDCFPSSCELGCRATRQPYASVVDIDLFAMVLYRSHPAHHGAGVAQTGRALKAQQRRRRGGLRSHCVQQGRPPDTPAGNSYSSVAVPTIKPARMSFKHGSHVMVINATMGCFGTDGGAADV